MTLRHYYIERLGVLCLFACACLVMTLPRGVYAQQVIKLFDADVLVGADAVLHVEEEIVYDFTTDDRHGIFRTIPTSYTTPAGTRSITLDVVSVLKDGLPEPYVISSQQGVKKIKIGDPDVTISGAHIYEIAYTVKGAVNYFDDFDEIYWNVTGNGWTVPINSSRVVVRTPQEIVDYACYKGTIGIQSACDTSTVAGDEYTATGLNLAQGEGLTVALSLPKGALVQPSLVFQILSWLKDNSIILLPLIVFFVMYRLWYAKGKDPQGRGTIITQYEPPRGMKPTFVGALVDEKIDTRDITAGLLWLAEEGYLSITRIEKKWLLGSVDYMLTWLKDPSPLVDTVEGDIAEAILGKGLLVGSSTNISELKKDASFTEHVRILRKRIHRELSELGYYEKNPEIVRGLYMGIGGGLLIAIIFLSGFFGTPGLFSGIVSGLIIMVFGFIMPKKTPEGAVAKEHILGFKEFLSVTEKDRLAFHNAPEKSPELFMKFLPYAIALGVETLWASQFESLYIESPEWYKGTSTAPLFASAFIGDMNGFTSTIGRSFTSAAQGGRGSGGGGFSGGGFGGGGGGSW